MKDFAKSIRTQNSSNTKEEAKTKDEYFKLLKFYQTQGYKTNAGEYNSNGRIKLHKGEDSVEIVLVGNSLSMPKTKYDDEISRLEKEYMDVGKKYSSGSASDTIKILDEKDRIAKRLSELKELRSQEWKKQGNSKVGNYYITDLMGQANEYSKGFSEALKKGDKAEAEKVSGYAKILKKQIKEEREEIQKRLKDLDTAERIMGSVGNKKIGNTDPRIQAFKSKIPALEKQGDIGALKDIYSFVDDMIKSLQKKREELARDMAQIDKDIGSYIDLRSELKNKI